MRALFLTALAAAQVLGGAEPNTREGAELVDEGRLAEALRAFARAREAHPDAPEGLLNLAGVHYLLAEEAGFPPPSEEDGGPLAEAERGYRAALGSSLDEGARRDALFNLGNTLFRKQAYQDAVGAYGEALSLDPEDREARQNLERALLRLRPQEEPQSGDGEEGEPPPESEEQSESQSQDGGEPPPSGEEQPRPQPSEGDRSEDGASAADLRETPEISPEQAERILAALARIEREFHEEQLEKRRARALRRGRH